MALLPTTMLLVLLLIAFSGLLPRWVLAAPNTITESLDVSQQHLTGATYVSFMTRLDSAVERTTDAHESIEHHPLLGVQKLWQAPACWINVGLTADGNRLLTLAIRSDNLYVSGFRNRHGDWFAFAGEGKTLSIKSELSYGGRYADIFGDSQGWKGLAHVQVNRATALDNARILAEYSRSGAGPDPSDISLKPALGFFILTISEAERFPRLRAALAGAMAAPNPQTMSQDMVKLAVNWKTLSCALRYWDLNRQAMGDDGAWNDKANVEAQQLKEQIKVYKWQQLKEQIKVYKWQQLKEQIKVYKAQQLKEQIKPLLRSKDCSWMPRSAAPMDMDNDGPTVQPRPASASVHAE